MENFDLVQKLKLELIRAYEQYVETIAGLTDASEDDAREALHLATCQMLVGLTKRPPGNPIVAWRPYIIQAAIHQLIEAERRLDRLKTKIVPFSQLDNAERLELHGKAAPQPTPAEQLEQRETATVLWTEVAILSPREGDVLRRWAHGSSFAEIAVALGIKSSTVRKLWSRGIRHLRNRPQIQRLAA